jgi:O-antigen ligase
MKKQVRLWALFAGPLVTLALGFGWTFDNVNTVKLLALGFVAGFAVGEIILVVRKSPKVLLSPIFMVALLFLVGLLVPLVFSTSPVAQQIYGVSGRNLGFLHYFFLLLILLGISTLNAKAIWPKILRLIAVLGAFQAGYGFLQSVGLDLFPWENPDKWIFGTFGNPNYLSSFLSLSAIATAYLALAETKRATKIVCYLGALFQSGVVLLSDSSQGLILLAFGLFAIIMIVIFQRSKVLGWLFFSLGSLAALLATFGIFQSGPLSRFLYQDSVSYRGDYWRAGIRMFQENWVYGVGLDSYGDYYRMFRDATAANRRGLDIVSNSAHNLFIDLAATGGIFLLVGYVLVLGLVSLSILRSFRSVSKVTLEYKILIILWLAFNLQTIISINVPSLAIWGWIFSGLILAYNNQENFSENVNRKIAKKNQRSFIVVSSICCLACMTFVSPLISRDVQLNKALSENAAPGITQAILTFPRDADQIVQMAIAFEEVGLDKESLELAKRAISENSNSARAWKFLVTSSIADSVDKDSAVKALNYLDPFYVAELK